VCVCVHYVSRRKLINYHATTTHDMSAPLYIPLRCFTTICESGMVIQSVAAVTEYLGQTQGQIQSSRLYECK